MTSTPLSRFYVRSIALIIFCCWTAAWVLALVQQLQFSWSMAIADGLVSNLYLAVGCIVISNMLGFYQPQKERFVYIMLVTLVLTALVSYVAQYSLIYLFKTNKAYLTFLNYAIFYKGGIAFICLAWCALANLLWYRLEDQNQAQQRLLATQSLAKEAELNKLRHQLQPHFLFNSLNSVYALTIVNPAEAGQMITKLAAFLRGTLKRDDEVWVSVADEMEYIQLYLAIEKVRFSHRLQVEVDVAEATLGLQLPGTLLQPIVENAIKFGLYNTSAAVTIRIVVSVAEGMLSVLVSNPYDAEQQHSEGTGFGLSAIRRRLYLLFADTSLLSTHTANNNLYLTTLKIPQKHDQSHTN